MGLQDRDYMTERAWKRLQDDVEKAKKLKGEFNDNKYRGREWFVPPKRPRPTVEGQRDIGPALKRFFRFFKHRSGKNVPLSLKELIFYAALVIGTALYLDRPHLPFAWRFFPVLAFCILNVYVWRQYKIRTYKP